MNNDELIEKHNIRATIGTQNELLTEIRLMLDEARADENIKITREYTNEIIPDMIKAERERCKSQASRWFFGTRFKHDTVLLKELMDYIDGEQLE